MKKSMLTIIFMSSVLFGALVFVKADSVEKNSLGELLKSANDSYKKGDFIKAVDYYEKFLVLDPNDYDVLVYLGASYDEIGQSAKAIEVCKRAIKISPDKSGAYLNLGMIFRNLNQLNDEIFNFKEAIKYANPLESAGLAHINLGFTYMRLSQYEDAQFNFTRAIEINPKNCEAYNWSGFCYSQAGKLQEARERYLKAIEINPEYSASYIGLGVIYQKLGDRIKVGENYRKAIDLLRKNGREQEARELEQLIAKELL